MTRFQILDLIGRQSKPLSCKELASLTGTWKWDKRAFRASFATRLKRLWGYGLLLRQINPALRPAHSRTGVYVWSLSLRGQKRLAWAKSKGFV
jgi:hypothetical protein